MISLFWQLQRVLGGLKEKLLSPDLVREFIRNQKAVATARRPSVRFIE
jgi:hypothetical protein